ncbi:hypothetical protein [Micromonospora aurantiaca (nom. illeg.)]|uniref:hypothetical protein n=1 Tax=Micromonospora aurantiaca (nom. illeg.) TaxID=47850 RepID=UPI003F4A10B0
MMSGISRRQLLTVAGLTVGAAWVDLAVPATPATAALGTGQLTIEPLVQDPIPVLSARGAAPQAVPQQLAVRVRGDNVALLAGTKLTVAFDRRLYAPLTTPLATRAGRRVLATATTAPDPSTGQTACTLTLNEDVPAGVELVALLGTVNPHRYPHDLTVAPATVAAGLSSRGRAARRDLTSPRPSSWGGPTEPWGVEVGAGWSKLTWGPDARYRYYYPVIATVTGSGPGRTPAAEFTVSVDPRIVTDIGVAAARLNHRTYPGSKIKRVESTASGSLRRFRWRADVRLGAGDQLDVMLRVTTGSLDGPLETITHPVVSSGMTPVIATRRTGRESVSRTDSSWR